MKKLGNFLWFLPCGLVFSLLWSVVGIALCLTIVGIPFGKQCLKIARVMRFPFGKVVDTCYEAYPLANTIWALINSVFALVDYVIGAVLCVTIIGIPFGKQCFKLARITLLPFGALVSDAE